MDDIDDIIERRKELEKEGERLKKQEKVLSLMLIVSVAMVIMIMTGPREFAIITAIILFILSAYNLAL